MSYSLNVYLLTYFQKYWCTLVSLSLFLLSLYFESITLKSKSFTGYLRLHDSPPLITQGIPPKTKVIRFTLH